MPSAYTFPVGARQPSFAVPQAVKTRVLKTQFGDGYQQRARDGINNLAREWSLRWEALTAAELATITDFLEARAGYQSFNWTPPAGATAYMVVAETWNTSLENAGVYNLDVTFAQVFA